MKNTRAVLLAVVLGLTLGGCSKEDKQGFPKVDYNKDGKVIFEELIVVFPDLTVDEFLAADADHSGALDEREYQRFREARQSGKKLDASSPPLAPANTSESAKPAPAPESKPAAESRSEPQTTPAASAPASQAVPASAPAPAEPATQAEPAKSGMPPVDAAETVETVVAESPSPAPAGETAKTYTVGRGDTLTRIAKKFGVSSKDILAANNLKNADRLEAGATLTIPASGGAVANTPAAPAAVTDFVAGYFAKITAGDTNGLVDCYGDSVNYYKKGKVGTDVVRQDKVAQFTRWPGRAYKPEPSSVETLKGGDLRVTTPVAFTFTKGDKREEGQAKFTFILRPAGNSYKIVGEQSVVAKK